MPSETRSLTESTLSRTDFDRLVVEHGASCLRLARAIAPSEAVAEEVVQQALLTAYRARAGCRGEGSAKGWLLTITRHTAYRVCRKERRHDGPSLLELGLEAGWGSDNPEAAAVAAERKETLERALGRLSDADREVIMLRDIEQLDGNEASEILGIGVRAMKSRLHRARLRLIALLRQEEGTDGGV